MNTVMPERIGNRWVYPSRATSTVLNPNFSAINTTVTWNADSNYHGLQTVLKRNLRSGLQGQAAYTWSKSIDTGSSISSVSSGTGYESSFAVADPAPAGAGPRAVELRRAPQLRRQRRLGDAVAAAVASRFAARSAARAGRCRGSIAHRAATRSHWR